eukprot:gene41124-50171_t
MAPLPLLKLAGLLVKTLAKPVANRIKIEARKHPKLSALCVRMGQMSHQLTSRITIISQGYRVLNVDPLPEEEALSRGINILSETFVFTVAGTLLTFEYARSEAKSAQKAQQIEEQDRQFRAYLEQRFEAQQRELQGLQTQLTELQESLEQRDREARDRDVEGRRRAQEKGGRGRAAAWSWVWVVGRELSGGESLPG